jgi:hypothetical protein
MANPSTENLPMANPGGWTGLAAAGGAHDRRWDGSPGPAALGEPGIVTGGGLASATLGEPGAAAALGSQGQRR